MTYDINQTKNNGPLDAKNYAPEEARNDTLLETSSHNDGIILAISEGFHAFREPIESLRLIIMKRAG